MDILIPTWNNAQMLTDCLTSLIAYQEYPYKVHVLNNGMAKDEQGVSFEDFLHRTFPDNIVYVYNMGENKGWQGALNWAWHNVVESDHMLALNDDTVFLPWHRTFLRDLASHMKHEDVGAVGPVTNVVMGSQHFSHRFSVMHQTSLLIGFCCLFKSSALQKISDPDPWDESLPGS